MSSAVTRIALTALGCVLFGVLACEEDDKTKTPAPTQTSASQQPAQAKPAPDKSTIRPRPKQVDTALSAARRAKIESAVPEAKGFLVAQQLETEVEAIDKINKESLAVRWLDEQAKGKWVLFTAPYNKISGEGFELPFNYARKSKRDPFGMSRMWVFVEFEDVKGHSTLMLNNGATAVILAKYLGDLKASPGHDLIALGLW
jgi:hypothetical protein